MTFHRYPSTQNRSLKAVSAADTLLLKWLEEQEPGPVTIQHDRFGVIAASTEREKQVVITFDSQRAAHAFNFGENGLDWQAVPTLTPLAALPEIYLAPARAPKSLDLFALYLSQIAASATPKTKMAVGFMTKYFTPNLLKISGAYAGAVEQTRAMKKGRLLLLSDFKTDAPKPSELVKTMRFDDREYRQYYGVFSGDHIDYATQFLLQNWPDDLAPPATILDVGCGNGVILKELSLRYPQAKLIATDDNILAIESTRLNMLVAALHCTHRLDVLEDDSVDLVVTNPPFHFGHDVNVEVSLDLFKQARRVLRPGGSLLVVGNAHLGYGRHLERWYGEVEGVARNEKFVVYSARQTAVT